MLELGEGVLMVLPMLIAVLVVVSGNLSSTVSGDGGGSAAMDAGGGFSLHSLTLTRGVW